MSYTREAVRMLPLFMVQNGAYGHTNPACICVRQGATTMSKKHATTTDALQAVMVAACAYVEAAGMCCNIDLDKHDPSLDSPYCDANGCTYCALARACDSLPEEMKP